MASATQRTETAASETLEERLPGMLDEVLGRLEAVGVDRIVDLARAMATARAQAPADAHLEPQPGQEN